MDSESLFWELFDADTETAVSAVVERHTRFDDPRNWKPYGRIESNFGVVENQQASPIPALVEKVINSIDAILTRRCLEDGIDPRSSNAPRSVDDAVGRFFPDSGNWDLRKFRSKQAESIQIIADGPRFETSLLIYDDGEGQHPQDFEDTFLSLLKGNKNEIHFVQGKYNMGGAGAIAFCGQQRYQLIGSRRWDGSGGFGFTLLRRHPLTEIERTTKRNTWYEYFAPNGFIPSFTIQDLDLGLRNRRFTTGSIIKLYSYDLPSGSRSVISRDLNQSLNEYLFNPALPFFTIDQPYRYPQDKNLQRDIYGLKRRLEEDSSSYVEDSFSESLSDSEIGFAKVTTYVFRPRVGDRSVKETKRTIRQEFFKNNMTVIFSVNGQVHGHYTSEFVSRTLKLQLLKDYVLIHVDCTDLDLDFRQELFMASRDRLKDGKESRKLRRRLGKLLREGRLKDIYKARKAQISVDDTDADDLLRNLTSNLPFRNELMRLFDHTLKLKGSGRGKRTKKRPKKPTSKRREPPPFHPQRFPSFFRAEVSDRANGTPMVQIPLGGQRTIKFSTDVENQYFDRISDPGELSIGLLQFDLSERGGKRRPLPNRVDQLFNVVKSSPNRGTIRLGLNPTNDLHVGDAITISARLTGPGGDFQENILVRIADRERHNRTASQGPEHEDPQLGLPKLVRVYQDKGKGDLTWEELEEQGVDMDYATIVHPAIDDDVLTEIYVNMASSVWLNHRSSLKTQDAITVAEKRYISAVYFHTLFLYAITQNRKYSIQRDTDDGLPDDVPVVDYVKDLLRNHYAEFLLTFEMDQLITALED
ncbi:MAG: hypothetical protein OXI76_13365 [Gemmatimonadota bacterium]|nr:hypothetical protein [Gemmatimonadota bacterium]